MSCIDKALSTPGSLSIETFIRSKAGNCRVDDELSATHEVRIKNYGNFRYFIDIHGECRTVNVQYRGTVGPPSTWDLKELNVPSRPGHGAGEAVASQFVTSRAPSRTEFIATDITWVVSGYPRSRGSDSLAIYLETL